MKASRVSVESVTLPSCCLATFWSFFSLDSTPTTHTSLFFAFTFYVFHDAGSVSAAACRVAAVSWFEFQNLSDWLPVLTADDLMETLLSGALKNRRMIYNETQPLSLFRWRGCGGGWMWGLGSALDSWVFMFIKLLTFMLGSNQKQPLHLVEARNRIFFNVERKKKKKEKDCLQTCGALMHI